MHSVSKPSWTTAARTALGARVIAIADGEQRPARRDGGAGQDRVRDLADAVEVDATTGRG